MRKQARRVGGNFHCAPSGSNDSLYLSHIVCVHYCANFGCGKCLDVVFPSRQKLSKHKKWCKGLIVDEEGENTNSSSTKEAPKTSSSSKKKKHKSQKPQANSQLDLQTHPQTDLQTSSQMSSVGYGMPAARAQARST